MASTNDIFLAMAFYNFFPVLTKKFLFRWKFASKNCWQIWFWGFERSGGNLLTFLFVSFLWREVSFPHAFVFTFSHAFVAHTLPKNKCVCTCVSFWHAFKNVFAWKFDRALTRLQYNLIQLHVDMMKHLSMRLDTQLHVSLWLLLAYVELVALLQSRD